MALEFTPITHDQVVWCFADPRVEAKMLKYCNFGRYSKCIDCVPPSGEEFGFVRVIERINVNL